MLAKLLKSFFTGDFIKKGLKFGVTTLSACVINFGVNIIGHECFGISVNILYPIALILVSISSFLQFRFFVFPDASKRSAVKQGWQFFLSSVIFRILEWALFFVLYNIVAFSFHWWYAWCIIIVQTIGTVSKFFFYNSFIFGRRDTHSLNANSQEPSTPVKSGTAGKRNQHWGYQLFLAALCTAAVVFLCKNIFQHSEKHIELSFTLQYVNQHRNHWQVFFFSKEGKKWTSIRPVFMSDNNKIKVSVVLPGETLEQLRLDWGSNPGKVTIENFVLKGERNYTLQDMKLLHANQIKNLKLASDGLTCSSNEIDPYLVFLLKKPLTAMKINDIDFWALAIIAFSSFVVFLAAARLLTISGSGAGSKGIFVVDGLLTLFFLVSLFLPMSKIDDQKISPIEKRKLAPFKPLISSDQKFNYQFGRNFDSWFNDHFFGRDALLRFDVFLFNLCKSPIQVRGNVFYGFDNWYFLSKENALRNYHNLDLFTAQQLEQAVENINKIDSICRKYGKKFYIVIIPDKHKVYGEFFPAAPKIRPDEQSRPRQFESYVSRNTSVPVINLVEQLKKNKSKGLLYWKNNTHWNEMGAFMGYLGIMERIRKDFPDVPVTRPKIRSVKNRSQGDLVKIVLRPQEIEYPVPQLIRQYKVIGDPVEQSFGSSLMINPKGKYNVLIIRDSFSSSLLPYMGNSFRSTTALWSNYVFPQHKINAFKSADIVIFECVDRLLPFMLNGIKVSRYAIEQGVK